MFVKNFLAEEEKGSHGGHGWTGSVEILAVTHEHPFRVRWDTPAFPGVSLADSLHTPATNGQPFGLKAWDFNRARWIRIRAKQGLWRFRAHL